MSDLINEQGGYVDDDSENDEYHQKLIDADCFSDEEISFLRMKKRQRNACQAIKPDGDFIAWLEGEINKKLEPKKKTRGSKKSVKCQICKADFEARIADLKRGWGKYCSKSCKGKSDDNKGSYLDAYFSMMRGL